MDPSSSRDIKSERDWIEHRVERLKALRMMVDDDLALKAIQEMIEEAEARIRKLSD